MLSVVVGVVGGTYASVPLYKVFCQRTGFGGTTQRVVLDDGEGKEEKKRKKAEAREGLMAKLYEMSNAPASKKVGHGGPRSSSSKSAATWTDEDELLSLRTLKPVAGGQIVTVTFDSNVSAGTPFTFRPATPAVRVVAGETALAFFTCRNNSTRPVTGVATYNVYPPKAGLYFNKVQCFCFEQQRLLPGEEVDMPVFFYLDPEIYEDEQLRGLKNVTLSYTFFDTGEEEDDDEEED